MSELTDFLLARIGEDELRDCGGSGEYREWYEIVEAFEAHAKAAHAKARRRIVEQAAVPPRFATQFTHGVHHAHEQALRALALPYAGHPDYRPEWWKP